ncbi:MAG: septum formation protein Maf [Paludibacteraceae bacterium]|nr:septum formation protein Maf [Paludibacteraceae bacterium]
MLENYDVILASNSPRRRELLAGLDISFEVKTIPGLEESYPATLKRGEIPLYLAQQKAHAYDSIMTDRMLLITADTIVWSDDQQFGKPKDAQDAIQMIHRLSGKTHQVYTGVCIRTLHKEVSFVAKSDVTFAQLSDEEIAYYVERYRPFDKAGSYGVQEWIGYVAVEHIDGSFYNVMGLPVQRVYQELKKFDNKG